MSIINSHAEMKGIVSQRSILDNNLLFKIELADGTSQLVQIPESQVRNLGVQVRTEPKVLEQVPLITSNVDTQVHTFANVEVTDKLHEDKASHFVYKIIKPEDLNLKPVVKTHLTRGRPRKRLKQNENSTDKKPDGAEETKKVTKPARTRSGRITKPPKHIEKDFKKIDISNDSKHETDLKTCEFEPLRTNDTPSEEPLQSLKNPVRRRTIPPRFRCPTCKKVYLGRIRILNHFQKHPEHRSTAFSKFMHNNTWNFLVLTSQKYKFGSKGAKFCEELEVLLQNARYLAQYLFKPVSDDDEEGYFVNDMLAYIFGLTPGKYNIDESELSRDVTLYEYLESNDSNCEEVVDDLLKVEKKDTAKSDEKKNSENIQSNFDPFYMLNNNDQNGDTNYIPEANNKNGSFTKENLSTTTKALETQTNNPTNIQYDIATNDPDIVINKEPLKSVCATSFPDTQQTLVSSNNNSDNRLALVKYELHPKNPSFLFNNHTFGNINTDLDHLDNFNNQEKSVVFDLEPHKTHTDSSQHLTEKQNSHITLQNELRDVDELMLVHVDAGQVSNILDTSSNSDDIMNVDQFVNERFKKLTEPDMDIQHNLLNLELPPLDMFQFHTS